MEKILEITIADYKYETKEERDSHVELMEAQGFECDGQVKKSDDSLWEKNRDFYWYAKFYKTN